VVWSYPRTSGEVFYLDWHNYWNYLTSNRTIADHVAKSAPKSKTILIDAFGGAGGNAIAFALSGRWQQIFVFEKDPHVIKCAKHNAGIYGVEKKIMWVQADCLIEIPKRFRKHVDSAVIFASPPWGGEYICLSMKL
jgi:trimethylguanosine synthase